MQQSHSLTVTSNGGLLRVLESPCHVCQGFDPQTSDQPHPTLVEFKAIWDTGATASVITQKVVDNCGLSPIGMVLVHGVHGTSQAEVYVVNIRLPNGVGIKLVNVSKGDLVGGCDVLIGMDIINLGDFAVTNQNKRTVFSFRLPSSTCIDFVQEHNRKLQGNSFSHGGSKKNRKKKSKQFGKHK